LKCSKCNENQATYYISHEMAGGARIGFCDSCAEEIGIFSALRRVESLLHGYGLKAEDSLFLDHYPMPIEFADKCKSCGTDIREFERRFYFGCEECSLVFGSLISNYLSLLGVGSGTGVPVYPGNPPAGFREKNELYAVRARINKSLEEENFKEAARESKKLEKLESGAEKRRARLVAAAEDHKETIPRGGAGTKAKMLESCRFPSPPEPWLMSCVEVRRNFCDFNFPPRLDQLEMNFTKRYISSLFTKKWLRGVRQVEMTKKRRLELKVFEARLLGRRLYPGSTLLASPDFDRVALINNLDHLTIIDRSGEKDHSAALSALRTPLRAIEKKADIAYSSRFGYLTSAPKYLGTGLSASVVLHMPYSLLRGRTYSYPSRGADLSVRFEPLMGNNFEQHGFFRVSSTIGFGRSEKDIVEEVFNFASLLETEENRIREEFKPSEVRRIENVMKKVLHHSALSYRLSFQDVLRFTSFITLGIDLGVVEMPGFNMPDVLPSLTSAYIMHRDGRRYTVNECEKRRADLFADLIEQWARPELKGA